jgi:hypothetical protein
MLAGIVARRISSHLEEHSLLSTEQMDVPGSKRCEDQLLISKQCLKTVRRKGRI